MKPFRPFETAARDLFAGNARTSGGNPREPAHDAFGDGVQPRRMPDGRPRPPCSATLANPASAALAARFEGTGGAVDGDTLAALLRKHATQPISQVARWIVERRIVTFCEGGRLLVPLFQFDLAQVSLRPAMPRVIALLSDTFDEFELATWFAEPNERLHGVAPAECISVDERSVVRVARADRLMARLQHSLSQCDASDSQPTGGPYESRATRASR